MEHVEDIFWKADLLKALKKIKVNGRPLPYTYKSLLDLERKGVIPMPRLVRRGKHMDRVYTRVEIDNIVGIVKSYKQNQYAKPEEAPAQVAVQ